jgi:hypothetical protein
MIGIWTALFGPVEMLKIAPGPDCKNWRQEHRSHSSPGEAATIACSIFQILWRSTDNGDGEAIKEFFNCRPRFSIALTPSARPVLEVSWLLSGCDYAGLPCEAL